MSPPELEKQNMHRYFLRKYTLKVPPVVLQRKVAKPARFLLKTRKDSAAEENGRFFASPTPGKAMQKLSWDCLIYNSVKDSKLRQKTVKVGELALSRRDQTARLTVDALKPRDEADDVEKNDVIPALPVEEFSSLTGKMVESNEGIDFLAESLRSPSTFPTSSHSSGDSGFCLVTSSEFCSL